MKPAGHNSSRRPARALTRRIVIALGLALGLAVAAPGTASAGPREDDPRTPTWPTAAPVNSQQAKRSAALVAAEDRRITQVRTVSSLARWQGRNWKTPYRLSMPSGYTLVLTPSARPYTLADLLALEPQTLQKMSDGSYLLSEHLVVMPRAVLRLSAPEGLRLRLSSGPQGFSTITSLGGEIDLLGTPAAPMTLGSWDTRAAEPDRQVLDGRAYVRAVGGQFRAQNVKVSDLGFWSGRTGGLALTGTDRPNTGAIVRTDKAATQSGPSVLDDVQRSPAGRLDAKAPGSGLDFTVPAQDYVSSSIQDTTITGNAYGLFVSGANGVQVTNTTVRDSLLGGIVLHRFVTNGSLTRTTATHNVGNGFTLDRATTGVTVNESTSQDNSGSGFVLSGRSLADGPSAVGSPIDSYGNNSVANSVARSNGSYGIEVLGGFNVGVQNNRLEGNDMGVVVDGPATKISVTGNDVVHAVRHGIAFIDGVTKSTVTGNIVDGSSTGVYVRDSAVTVRGNTVQEASVHGVSLVGAVDGSLVSANVLSGNGPSALDTVRSADRDKVTNENNQTSGWDDTTPWYLWFRQLLHPMNALWGIIALLVLLSAVRSRRQGSAGRHQVAHPYAHQLAHHGHLPMPAPAHPQVAGSPALPDVIDLREDAGARVGG
jgi:Periplasmic copper-binding protein (NosD)